MNRRDFLAGTSAGALIAFGPLPSLAADDNEFPSYHRVFTSDGMTESYAPISYYTNVSLAEDVETAESLFSFFGTLFAEKFAENMEKSGFYVLEQSDENYKIDRFEDDDAFQSFSFRMVLASEGFYVTMNAIVAQKKRCVQTWFSMGLVDTDDFLTELADKHMRFTARKRESLVNMIPGEDDLGTHYDVTDDGFDDDVTGTF